MSSEIGPEIDNRNHANVGHGFTWHPPDFNDFEARTALLNALRNGKSPAPEPEGD
jgi:hypothetical protein